MRRPANRCAEWVDRLERLFPSTPTQTYTITAKRRETRNPGELILHYTQLSVSTPAHGVFLIVITADPHEDSQPIPASCLPKDNLPEDNVLTAELVRRKRLLWESWPVVVRDGVDVVGLVAAGSGWEGTPEAVMGFRLDCRRDLADGEEEEHGAMLVQCVRGFVGAERWDPRMCDGSVDRFLVGVRNALPFVPGWETVMQSIEG